MNKNNKPKFNLIAAVFAILMGLVLAIGYPSGGIKANKTRHKKIIHRTNITPLNSANKQIIKKSKPKHKKVISVTPPPSEEDSQDEGC